MSNTINGHIQNLPVGFAPKPSWQQVRDSMNNSGISALSDSWISPNLSIPKVKGSFNFGSLLSGLGSFGGIASSLLGAVFGNSAYKRQLRMMREQNAFQKAERESQNQWNLEQWFRENAYNTPLAQRSRLNDAGINPYMMLSGGNTGTASALSGNSSGAPGAPSAPFYNPTSGVTDTFNQFANRAQQQALIESQIFGNYRQGDYIGYKGGREERSLSSEISRNNADAEANRALASLRLQEKLNRIQEHFNLTQDGKTKAILNKYLDAQQQASLNEKIAQVIFLGVRTGLTRAEINKAVQETTNLATQNKIDAKELEYLEKTNSYAIGAAISGFQLEEMANSNEYTVEQWTGKNTRYLRNKHDQVMNKNDIKYDGSERVTDMIYGGMNATANMGNATANVISSVYGVPLKLGTTENSTTTTYNSKGKVQRRVETSRSSSNQYGGRRR